MKKLSKRPLSDIKALQCKREIPLVSLNGKLPLHLMFAPAARGGQQPETGVHSRDGGWRAVPQLRSDRAVSHGRKRQNNTE
jgi:hypothetical protein